MAKTLASLFVILLGSMFLGAPAPFTIRVVDDQTGAAVPGLRILATRFRGRRMPANRYDVWMPSLGPSERLLRAGQDGRISWAKFARDYRAELKMDGPIRHTEQDHQEPRAEVHAAVTGAAR